MPEKIDHVFVYVVFDAFPWEVADAEVRGIGGKVVAPARRFGQVTEELGNEGYSFAGTIPGDTVGKTRTFTAVFVRKISGSSYLDS